MQPIRASIRDTRQDHPPVQQELISPGDRIIVGLSGEKDSLTMCHVLRLCLLRDSHSIPFIQFSNISDGCDLNYLWQFCNKHRVELKMVEDEIREAYIGGRSGSSTVTSWRSVIISTTSRQYC
jgi:tRNA(Ile)-lysidine synthase TilS/MesJ